MQPGCLHKRRTEKGLPTSELEILHKVEGMVEQEFSFALHISRAEIGQYIRDRLCGRQRRFCHRVRPFTSINARND